MAIYHFTLRMVQRSSGQSIVAIAADRARVVLQDHRLDRRFAPLPAKHHTRPVLSEILLPEGAPKGWRDRETLWKGSPHDLYKTAR